VLNPPILHGSPAISGITAWQPHHSSHLAALTLPESKVAATKDYKGMQNFSWNNNWLVVDLPL